MGVMEWKRVWESKVAVGSRGLGFYSNRNLFERMRNFYSVTNKRGKIHKGWRWNCRGKGGGEGEGCGTGVEFVVCVVVELGFLEIPFFSFFLPFLLSLCFLSFFFLPFSLFPSPLLPFSSNPHSSIPQKPSITYHRCAAGRKNPITRFPSTGMLEETRSMGIGSWGLFFLEKKKKIRENKGRKIWNAFWLLYNFPDSTRILFLNF